MAINGKELVELGANSAGAAIGIAVGEGLGSWVERLIKSTDEEPKVKEKALVKIAAKIGLGIGAHWVSVIPGIPREAEPWLDSIAAGSIGSIVLDVASVALKKPASPIETYIVEGAV